MTTYVQLPKRRLEGPSQLSCKPKVEKAKERDASASLNADAETLTEVLGFPCCFIKCLS